jgi:predicted RNA binding protein with dsRBD fold (UPF0201 family)
LPRKLNTTLANPFSMPEIFIEASLFPTEVEDRVRQAILNIFPDAEIEVIESSDKKILKGKASDIKTLAKRLAEQKIRDAARKILRKSIKGQELVFHLNKQAALVNKVNFTEGKSVLGDIKVKIAGEPEAVIDRLSFKVLPGGRK